MSVKPETALHEQKLLTAFLQQRCLQLAQALVDLAAERDQAIADRDAWQSAAALANGEIASLSEQIARAEEGEANGAPQ